MPRNYGHYIENAGDGPARVLAAFNNGEYRAVDLSDWLANNPAAVVAHNFRLPDAVVCYLDSTVALPLLTAYARARHKPRKLKRLYDRRAAMMKRLLDEYRNAGGEPSAEPDATLPMHR